MFKKLFGAKDGRPAPHASSATANRTIDAIQELADQEESLEKRKALVEKRIEAELEKARAFLKQQKKPQAMQCMRRKKLLENDVSNLDNMIMRITEQRQLLEGQRNTAEAVAAMHKAAQIAKATLKDTKVENVDKVLEDIQDANDAMRQIHDALGQPIGDPVDEEELLGELEDMEAAEMDKELLAPAPVPSTKIPGAALPSVPTTKAGPARASPGKTAEELELEALQAEMAL